MPGPSDSVQPGLEFEDLACTGALRTRVIFENLGADEITEEWGYPALEGGRALALGAVLSENKGEEWDGSKGCGEVVEGHSTTHSGAQSRLQKKVTDDKMS